MRNIPTLILDFTYKIYPLAATKPNYISTCTFKKQGAAYKHQSGYLLIVAIIAIVIIGVIGGILANMYIIATRSTINSLQSDQAFYIAKAGLEIARRDLLQTGSTLTCNAITGATKYTNACYPPGATTCSGYFTVEGLAYTPSITPTLTSALTSTATTISLSSTTGMSASGVIIIDTEIIWYGNISGTQLQNVKRGAFGTTSVAHTSGTAVNQNECILTSVGMVPTSTNPAGKRKLREILWKGVTPSYISSALISTGNITLGGTSTVNNPSINNTNTSGSTILCGGSVSLSGSAYTSISSNPIIKMSTPSTTKADIIKNNPSITTSTLWQYLFSQIKPDIQYSPSTTVVSNCNNYNFSKQTHGTVWISATNCNIPGNTTIGTATNPVTLIVSNSSATTAGNLTVNGLLYAAGSLTLNGSLTVNGLMANEGIVNFPSGSSTMTFNPQILSILGFTSSSPYTNYHISSEVFN